MLLIQKRWQLDESKEESQGNDPSLEAWLSEKKQALYPNNQSETENSFVWHDPFLLPDMEAACRRICTAVKEKQSILIYGDYDCDGVTATAMMVDFLRTHQGNVTHLIPDRMVEGYGLSLSHVDRIVAASVKLVITVDCGVASDEAVAGLMSQGVDVIITDHHELGERLPNAVAVINPRRQECQSPFPSLAGVGVALKLLAALSEYPDFSAPKEAWQLYLDIAALGTVADVVPIIDENRTILKTGLKQINASSRPGILALRKTLVANKEVIPEATATTLAFSLAPRINAAGRLGDAQRGVRLLLTHDKEEADRIAGELAEENRRRQELEASILAEAIAQIEAVEPKPGAACFGMGPLVVWGESWHPGVIGIVASRLVSRYGRPAVVLTALSGDEGILKGSARSTDGYNIFEALSSVRDLMTAFGGHPKAAGLSLSFAGYEEFCNRLSQFGQSIPVPFDAAVQVDFSLQAKGIDSALYNEIAQMAPFGEGNREPRFLLENCLIRECRLCGNDKHIKLLLEVSTKEKPQEVEAIAFGFGSLAGLYSPGRQIDLVVTLQRSIWRGQESITLQVVDLRLSDFGRLGKAKQDSVEQLYQHGIAIKQLAQLAGLSVTEMMPSRAQIRKVYELLKQSFAQESFIGHCQLLAAWLEGCGELSLNAFSLARILDIFAESGLLKIWGRYESILGFTLLFVDGKVKLEESATFKRLVTEGGLTA